MNIVYKMIDWSMFKAIGEKYGSMKQSHVCMETDGFSHAAVHDGGVIGFISVIPKAFYEPLADVTEAFINIIEVDADFRRHGIARKLIASSEQWAVSQGFTQLSAWSSADKLEAVPMWRKLGYGMCPAQIWIQSRALNVYGFYVVKTLKPIMFPFITKAIQSDIMNLQGYLHDVHLLRAKDGIYVFKCSYDDAPAVLKCFETAAYLREIANYQLLKNLDIPTIDVYALGDATILMQDIEYSNEWRMGTDSDLSNPDVAKLLAAWYFDLHEKGLNAPDLHQMYCEFDQVTVLKLSQLKMHMPEAESTFEYLIQNINKLQDALASPEYTLVYHDFYWTNFIVRKDAAAALMFDYNFLGKGFRYEDIRNVCSSLSPAAAAAFTHEYNRLYETKYKHHRLVQEAYEQCIDTVVSPIFTLIAAFEKENFPNWAKSSLEEVRSGDVLHAAKMLFQDEHSKM